MEKISLKPSFKDILHQGSEEEVFFDVVSFSGATTQEKNLGSIIVLSYLRQGEDDLSYLISLISSLAKREFYQSQSIAEQNSKAAFERTLRKLNEILVDYFKNKDFLLNLGLAVISGDNIYISRLGKFKVALARNGEYIDILNNISLFNKDGGSEYQFANIVSGKIKPNDKLFAYFPVRAVTSREKMLNPLFVSQNQEDFCGKIDQIAENVANFACCGIHVNIEQVKEIPVEIPKTPIGVQYASGPADIPASVKPVANHEEELQDEITPPPLEKPAPSKVIQAEVSVTKRDNIFTGLSEKLLNVFLFNRKTRLGTIGRIHRVSFGKLIGLLVVIVIISSVGWIVFNREGDSGEALLLNDVTEKLKLAKSRLAQNDNHGAREILRSTLAQIAGNDSEKIATARMEISNTLNTLDQVSNLKPEMVYNGENNDLGFTQIAVYDSKVYIAGRDNKLYSIGNSQLTELGQFKSPPDLLMANESFVTAFNKEGEIETYDLKNRKFSAYNLNNLPEVHDAAFYQGNLYILSGGQIYKYADVVMGGVKRVQWNTEDFGSGFSFIAIDGDIYLFDTNGDLIKLFKGKKESNFTLPLAPSGRSELLTDTSLPFVYMADFENKRVYVFNKETFYLRVSYIIENANGVRNAAVSSDGSIWLASDNSVWLIKP